MEHERPGRADEILAEIKPLPLPTPYKRFQEWKKETLQAGYRCGFVVGIVIDSTDPRKSTIYFDDEGIVLEAIPVKTSRVMKEGIKVNDLVQTNWFRTGMRKIASQENFKEQGVSTSPLPFDWDRVVGAI
jgi:hypothetical protein